MTDHNIKTANLIDVGDDAGHSTGNSSKNAAGFKLPTDESETYTSFRPKPRSHDTESPYDDTILADGFNFDDKSIRLGFMRRVYSILSIQLFFTFGVVILFSLYEQVGKFFAENVAFLYIPMIGTFVLVLVLACSESARRQSPINIIILTIFTIFESIIVGFISAAYDRQSVFLAMSLTFGIVTLLTAFAFQTKIDFTRFGPALLLILIIFILASFFVGIYKGFGDDSSRFWFACFGAVLFSIFIVYDTQLMMGGNHKYAISPEEYVHGALIIYLDVINLFLYILRAMGNRR